MPISRKSFNYELWLTLFAMVVSACALVVSVVQTRIAREQQVKSVWPYLQIREEPLNDTISILLENSGVGPAVIRRIEFSIGVEKDPYLPYLINRVLNYEAKKIYNSPPSKKDSDQPPNVLIAGDKNLLLGVSKSGSAIQIALRDRETRERDTLQISVVYGDIYDNCWQLKHSWQKTLYQSWINVPNNLTPSSPQTARAG